MPLPQPSAVVTAIALKHGAASCGAIPVRELKEYKRFAGAVKNAPPDLAYLGRSAAVRESVGNRFASARSVLVCAFQYWHSGRDYDGVLKKAGEPRAYLERTGRKVRQPGLASVVKAAGAAPKISRYALVPDYHKVIRKKLKEILAGIQNIRPGADGKIFVDTSPVMEKELGRLAGLGCRGKNTLLISEELGSYFFIGGLALNFDAGQVPPRVSEAGCGDCRRCIDACPTGALSEPGVLKPELCISYWTTQSKERMPEGLQARVGGFVYGCDLCQEACPYNGKTEDKVLKEFQF